MHRNDMANEELEVSDKPCTLTANGHKNKHMKSIVMLFKQYPKTLLLVVGICYLHLFRLLLSVTKTIYINLNLSSLNAIFCTRG